MRRREKKETKTCSKHFPSQFLGRLTVKLKKKAYKIAIPIDNETGNGIQIIKIVFILLCASIFSGRQLKFI